jgi:hypothetical protein
MLQLQIPFNSRYCLIDRKVVLLSSSHNSTEAVAHQHTSEHLKCDKQFHFHSLWLRSEEQLANRATQYYPPLHGEVFLRVFLQ